jgi:protein SCO1/2
MPILAVLVASGCSTDEGRASRYELRGQILAIRPEAREVLIKHGDIKGFMPGMTMPFRVRDERLLAGKVPGDLVSAELLVGKDDAWLDALEKTGSAPLAEEASFPAAAFASPVKPGDTVADVTLSDQDGKPLSLSGWRDLAVVVTFVYLRCPLPQFCPMMDVRFREIQRALHAEPALRARTRLLTVSFDPDHDTPAALAAHAAKLGAESEVWRFATAPRDTVDRLAARFGINVIREADRTITHNLRTAVIGPAGRVVSVYDGGDWTVDEVLADLRRALAQ